MPNTMKYRRRQVYLGVFVMLLSVFSVAEGVYFRHQDAVQRACMSHAFADLSNALGVRGDLVDRETANTNTIITRVFRAKSKGDALAAFAAYEQEEHAIQDARDAHPVPPYPQGKCDDR